VQEKDQEDKIEITPQMIEAGCRAFFDSMHEIDGYDSVPTQDQSAFLVSSIYSAMSLAGAGRANIADKIAHNVT
jgi:hypothetical protein